MKNFVIHLFGYLGTVALWSYALLRLFMDWVGRSTVVDDWKQLTESMPNLISWLLSTPSWVPAICAFTFTLATIYFMWRIHEPSSQTMLAAPTPARSGSSSLIGLRGIFSKREKKREMDTASNDHALILRQDSPLRVEAKRVEDGIDIGVKVAIRNRSRKTLFASFGGKPELTIGGKSSEQPGGGLTIPFAKESEQTSIFGGMRFYDGVADMVGVGRIHYKFGERKDDLTNLNIEIQFIVEADPSNDGKLQSLPYKIIDIKTEYSPVTA